MTVLSQLTIGGSRQRLLVLAAVGALLMALVLLMARPLLLGRAGPQGVAPQTTGLAAGAPRPPQPSTTLVPPSSSPPLAATKDPFRPLVASGGAAASSPLAPGAAGPGAGSSGGPAVPSTGNPPSQSTVPGAGVGTATVPGGGSTAERHKLTLLDVSDRSGVGYVKVSVDGSKHQAKEGERFAGSYRVVDVGSACASFESGTTPFTLCEGEAVLK